MKDSKRVSVLKQNRPRIQKLSVKQGVNMLRNVHLPISAGETKWSELRTPLTLLMKGQPLETVCLRGGSHFKISRYIHMRPKPAGPGWVDGIGILTLRIRDILMYLTVWPLLCFIPLSPLVGFVIKCPIDF
jgi:hypothetical protein